jgi:hypothetical protein
MCVESNSRESVLMDVSQFAHLDGTTKVRDAESQPITEWLNHSSGNKVITK